MITTIAILMVGCFVINAVVLSLGYFTNGARARPALAVGRRMRRNPRT